MLSVHRLGAVVAIWSAPMCALATQVLDNPRFTASGLSIFDGAPGFSVAERGEVIFSVDETVDFAAPALALVPELSVFNPVLELGVDADFGVYADFAAEAGVFSGAVDYSAAFIIPDAATLAPFQPVDLSPSFVQDRVGFEATTGSLDAAFGLSTDILVTAKGSVSDPTQTVTLGFDERIVNIADTRLVMDETGNPVRDPSFPGGFAFERLPVETELFAVRDETVEFLAGPVDAIGDALGVDNLPRLDQSFAELEAELGIVIGVPTGVGAFVDGQFKDGPGFALSTGNNGVGIDVGSVELSSPLLTVSTPETSSGAGVARSGSTNLVGLNVDADTALVSTTLPTIGGASLEVGPLSADFDILDLDIGVQSQLLTSYEFRPELGVRLEFSQPVIIDRSFSVFPPIPEAPFFGANAGPAPAFFPPPTIPNPFPPSGPVEITSLVLNQFDEFPLLSFLPGETIVTPTYFLDGGFFSDIGIGLFPELELSFLTASLKFLGNGPTVGPAFEETFTIDDLFTEIELFSLMAGLDGFGTVAGSPFTVATCADFTLSGENDATCATPIALPGVGGDGTVAPIPLPAAVWMLGAALAGLGVVGARRRSQGGPPRALRRRQ